MPAFLIPLLANKYVRMAGLVLAFIAVLHVAHCQHDKKLIADYEAGVQARIAEAVADATLAADRAAQERAESFEEGQDDIERATEGLGTDTPAGDATEAYHEALRRSQE